MTMTICSRNVTDGKEDRYPSKNRPRLAWFLMLKTLWEIQLHGHWAVCRHHLEVSEFFADFWPGLGKAVRKTLEQYYQGKGGSGNPADSTTLTTSGDAHASGLSTASLQTQSLSSRTQNPPPYTAVC